MAERIGPGAKAPVFSLPDQDGKTRTLDEFRGSYLILYFYPKDNTAGCTAQALAFTAVYEDLAALRIPVVGVSPDSVESHRRFIGKHDLKLTLLADPAHQVIEQYGVWILKKMYGREYFGVERSTFLIAPDGLLIDVWHSVRVKGHVEAVTARIKEVMDEG